ncbi:MAG TPA: acetate--CoA ligase family protein [Steroidobacteraceae bacterium]|nr:acetate--CoA ligase family protein [Steroidobacteraceae bacterium]
MIEAAPTASSVRNIERLLRPRSVAVVGASSTPGALGASVVANLERMGFGGEIHLINPKRDFIGERRCLPSVAELPLGVDVAVLAIPKSAVIETVRDLVKRQVGAAIIFSAGFAEGGEAGLADQRELARIASGSGMVIEGPNCLGLVNYVDGIALTFVETPAIALGKRAGVGIVSQSGAMAAVVGVTLTAKAVGISYSISTGNEAASGAEDYVEYLLGDANTRVIGLIVEQFRQPRRFLALAERALRAGKPVVLLHPGRSAAARDSASTHTGAMAGDYQVMRSLVERQGVLLTETLEEFSDLLELTVRFPGLPTRGPAVLTESGAFKALTLDLCEQVGLELPQIADDNALLRAALPIFVPVSNPVDLTAQALVDPDLYRRALSALLQDDRFGSVIFGIIQTDPKTCQLKFPAIIAAVTQLKPKKPVIFAGLDDGAEVPADYIAQLRALNVPYFPSADRAYRAMAYWCRAAHRDTAVSAAQPIRLPSLPPRGIVAEYRAKELLAPLGLRFPVGRLVKTLAEAQAAAAQIGMPVVLKAQSKDLPHKSDAGGVELGLTNAASIEQAWNRLHSNIARHRPGLELDGVLVEGMSPRGTELIVGGRNDPDWGPIVLAGFGGVQAEILHDVRLMPADLTLDGFARELQLLKSAPLLRGFRGSPPLDIAAVAGIISRIAALLRGEPGIREIDLNPVIVYAKGEGAIALDALLVLA